MSQNVKEENEVTKHCRTCGKCCQEGCGLGGDCGVDYIHWEAVVGEETKEVKGEE